MDSALSSAEFARRPRDAGFPCRALPLLQSDGNSPEPSPLPKFEPARLGGLHKYWHYVFVLSLLSSAFAALALLNGYFGFVNVASYSASDVGPSSSILLAGYLGAFVTILVSPVPDYLVVPVYGYLSSIHLFNPYAIFLLCLLGAVAPLEYVPARFARRPLVMKFLSYFRIREADIGVADGWIREHGRFSMFTATFIPFFYSVAAFAAGTLNMSAASFLLYSTVGFGLRYAFLESIGFVGILIFTSSFDHANAALFSVILAVSLAYAIVHLLRSFRPFSVSTRRPANVH